MTGANSNVPNDLTPAIKAEDDIYVRVAKAVTDAKWMRGRGKTGNSVPRRIRALWDQFVSKHGVPSPEGIGAYREVGYIPRFADDRAVPTDTGMPNLSAYTYRFLYEEEDFDTYRVYRWKCQGITLWEKIGRLR